MSGVRWDGVPKFPAREPDFAAPETPALERGARVAWVTKNRDARWTTGLSLVHRVFEGRETYCLETIPDAERLVPALHTMKRCRTCDENYASQATFVEIIQRSQKAGAA